jgi:hypothetical protein
MTSKFIASSFAAFDKHIGSPWEWAHECLFWGAGEAYILFV